MISLILPAYNESASIRNTVREIDAALTQAFPEVEIVVIDDGSIDGTANQLKGMPLTSEMVYIRSNVHRGKGSAIRTGISAARGTVIAYTDADLPIGIASIIASIEEVRSGVSDICVGNRFHSSSICLSESFPKRRLASWIYRKYVALTLIRSPNDPACCLKVYSRDLASQVATQATLVSYVFDVETLLLAKQLGAKIYEIPVAWVDKRSNLPFHQLFLAGFVGIRDIMFLRWRYGSQKLIMPNKD